MADISFNEEPGALPTVRTGPSGMAGWVIRKGIAKDEKSANMLLISVVVGAVAIAGFVFAFSGNTGASLDAKDRLQLEASTP